MFSDGQSCCTDRQVLSQALHDKVLTACRLPCIQEHLSQSEAGCMLMHVRSAFSLATRVILFTEMPCSWKV